MNRLPHPHHDPMFVGNGAPPAAPPAAPHPGRADALPNAAAAVAGGLDPLLPQREVMRLQNRPGQNDARRDNGHGDDAALLNRRVEELARVNGEYQRIVRAEIAAREMRDRVAASEAARGREREAARTTRNREAFCDALQEQQAIRRREVDRERVSEVAVRAGRPGGPSGRLTDEVAAGRAGRPSDPSRRAFGNALPGDPSGGAFGRGALPAKFGDLSGGVFGDDRSFNGSGGNHFLNLNRASGDLSSVMAHPPGGAFRDALRHQFLDRAAPCHGDTRCPMVGSPRLAEEMALREQIQRRMMEEAIRNQQHQQRQMHLAALTCEHNAMGPSSGERQQRTGHGNRDNLTRDNLTRLLQLQQMAYHEQAVMLSGPQQQHQQATMGEYQPSASGNQEHSGPGESGPGESQPSVSGVGEQPTGHYNREHLSRLLELQRMSELQRIADEDLLRRAAEAQNGHGVAPQDTLEHNKAVMESGLLHGGLPGGISRFGGAAATAGQDPGPGLGRGLTMMDRAQTNASAAGGVSNGSEKPVAVDQENSMQRQHSTGLNDASKPLRYFNNGIEVDADGNPVPTESGHAPAPASVPTNASNAPSPGLAGPASPGNNIIAKFLTVVVSRVPEIAPAMADLLPDGGDPAMLKRAFPNIVNATLAELRSVRERLSSAGDARGFDLIRRATDCISDIESYKVDFSNAGEMVPPPQHAHSAMPTCAGEPALATSDRKSSSPEPSVNTVSDRPVPVPGPWSFPPPKDELAVARQAQRHHRTIQQANQYPMMQQAHQAQMFKSDSAKEAEFKTDTAKKAEFTTLTNTKNEEAKMESPAVSGDLPLMAAYKAKKQKNAKKPKRNSKPKIVHAREASPAEGGEARRDEAPAEKGLPKSRPMKKRHVSGRGPHGELLHHLFDAPSGAVPELTEGVGRKDSSNSVVTAESEDRGARPASQGDEDGHYDAANVLLGLMGR